MPTHDEDQDRRLDRLESQVDRIEEKTDMHHGVVLELKHALEKHMVIEERADAERTAVYRELSTNLAVLSKNVEPIVKERHALTIVRRALIAIASVITAVGVLMAFIGHWLRTPRL